MFLETAPGVGFFYPVPFDEFYHGDNHDLLQNLASLVDLIFWTFTPTGGWVHQLSFNWGDM